MFSQSREPTIGCRRSCLPASLACVPSKPLSVGKRARTYCYQHREEDTPCNTHAQSNGPRGEQPQQQRATPHNKIGDLEGNRQPECPALPRQQSLCTEKGNNPSQEKNPRQKRSQNSDKSPWCRVTIRDVIDTYEASEKGDQADDDQEESLYC